MASPHFASSLAIAAAIALLAHPLRAEDAVDRAIANATNKSGEWCSPAILDGDIAAVINKDIVTHSQIRDLNEEQEKTARETLKDKDLVKKINKLRAAAANELINRTLVLQEFNKKASTLPEDLIDQRIETIIRDQFAGDREAFLQSISSRGYTLQRFRQLEREKIAESQMRGDVMAGKIHISEDQIADYYRQYDTTGKPLSELHEEIEKTLLQNASKRLLDDWIAALRKAAYIKIYQ